MRCYGIFAGLVLGGVSVLLAAGMGRLPAHGRGAAPATDCTVEVVSLVLNVQAGPPAARAVPNTADDSYVQFLAPPITTTAESTVTLTVNGSFDGTTTGTLAGTISGETENGVLVMHPGGTVTTPRGFAIGRVRLATSRGTITASLVTNQAAVTNTLYPRAVNGYLASNDMSGELAGKLLVVPIAGATTYSPTTGIATFSGTGAGRLFSGAAPVAVTVAGARSAPRNAAVSLLANDRLSQFRHAPITQAADGTGQMQPAITLAGTLGGDLSGVLALSVNSFLLDAPNSNHGWQAGQLALTNGADVLAGVWLGDLSPSGNPLAPLGLAGFVYEIAGSGQYSTSMLFANLAGAYGINTTSFAGTLNGAYCATSSLPPRTATATVTGTPPTVTVTGTPPRATATPTCACLSPTITPTVTGTPPTATPTGTSCRAQFTDVQSGDYFSAGVEYLAERCVISGYANDDGSYSFRPYNNTTRAQMVKIVVGAQAVPAYTPAAGAYTFEDVPPTHPFFTFIEAASHAGIVSGYVCGQGDPCIPPANRPYFRPSANVTRAQLSKIVAVAAGWALIAPEPATFRDVPVGSPFYSYVETAVCHSVVSGYSCGADCLEFRPGSQATRGQIAKIVYNTVTESGSCTQMR